MKSAFVYTAEGLVNTKQQRQRDIARQQYGSAPASYTSNSIKEELCLEYVGSFVDQYTQAYRQRKVPYMVAENEFGVKKFVCSTLRPTLIPVPELYDVYECAAFVAGYTMYEPLDPPNEPPKYLFSPLQVLESHTGDCFDLSNLLCSFLLGAGYDAYVVYGYAPAFITLKDQSKTPCPMISHYSEGTVSSSSSGVAGSSPMTAEGGKGSKTASEGDRENKPESNGNEAENDENGNGSNQSSYIPPDNTVKNSKFLADVAEKKRLESIDTFQLWVPDAPLDESKMLENEKLRVNGSSSESQRVHAWVLLRAGRRDIKEDTFVEASTGRVYNVKNSPYLGVEAVWNHITYYANSKLDMKVTEMQFNFNNDSSWEPLFLSKAKDKNTKGEKNGSEGHDEEDHDLMEGNSQTETNRQATEMETLRFFDAPTRWSAPLNLPRHKYLVRYPPNGKRTVQYYCAKADFFAKGVNDQCMVMRITLYLNKECTIVKEVHEWFENRVDRMYKRIRYYLDDSLGGGANNSNYSAMGLGNNNSARRFVEFFTPGSRGEIKKWTEYPGKRIDIDYYVNGRLDRLLRREEVIGQSIAEYFQGRTDLMTFRSFQLTAEKGGGNAASPSTRQFTLPPTHLGTELYITRIVQQFDRNPLLPDGEDISKRIFYVREGKAVFYYHFGKSQITGRIRTFMHTKGPSVPVPTDLAISQEIGLEEDSDACQEAAAFERECYSAIKTSYQLHDKLVESRLDGEMVTRIGGVESEKTVFERALDSVDLHSSSMGNSADQAYSSESKGTDYLSPFLRNVQDMNSLSKEEALAIRQACLDALKARLVERANIIQTKLHEENAKLGRKQELFQRSQREGDFSTEEYEKYCTEAMFRIQILEQRLAAHEEAALRKFSELDLKLSNDPRLRILKN